AGGGLEPYTREPKLTDGALTWHPGPRRSENDKILRPVAEPFQPTGGLEQLTGNLGRGVIKISAVAEDRRVIEAPARVFEEQEAVRAAFTAGEFDSDVVVVVRFQGPRANGMPELHGLTPVLSVLQARGLKVALVTDGRMSGASGKVPAAIHLSPEAAMGGPLARIRDGDLVRLDANAGTLEVLAEGFDARAPDAPPARDQHGLGRELFGIFRDTVGTSETGAATIL
ncbi:MAG TPA: phosphogluconate dehydratase, partial [Aliiroseovarius sp.]|nr:phosphogluconate dehydratase [Aliiroseovarius sp.]